MPAFSVQLHKDVVVEWFLEGDIVKQLYLHEKNSTAVLKKWSFLMDYFQLPLTPRDHQTFKFYQVREGQWKAQVLSYIRTTFYLFWYLWW